MSEVKQRLDEDNTRRRGAPICFIIERLVQRSGGAERIVIELANRLAKSGRHVHLVSYEKEVGEPFYALERGVTYLNLRFPTALRSYPRRALDLVRAGVHAKVPYPAALNRAVWHSKRGGFIRALEKYLELHEPQTAVAVAPPAMVVLAQAKRNYVLRTVASLHNVPDLDLNSSLRWDRNPLDIKRRQAALLSFDAITVLQPSFRAWFDETLRHKVHVVPNPVEPSVVSTWSQRETKIICVSRLAVPKRINILIEAWARLAPQFPHWSVEVHGAGILERKLKALIAERGVSNSFRLMGHTKDIGSVYQSASILAHPAEYEGWGLAVSEALARGIPTLGFADCAGVNELIIHEFNGLLVDGSGDLVAQFADGLRQLTADEELRRRLSEAGPGSVAEFSPAKIQAIWERIIDG